MVHSNKTGYFQRISFDKEFQQKHLVDWVTDLKIGDEIHRFRDAQDCIGEFILQYYDMDEMFEIFESDDLTEFYYYYNEDGSCGHTVL